MLCCWQLLTFLDKRDDDDDGDDDDSIVEFSETEDQAKH